MLRSFAPYWAAVWAIAFSSRLRYSSTICVSSMFFPPFTLYNDILSHLVARSKKIFAVISTRSDKNAGSAEGILSMDQSIQTLYRAGRITRETALQYAENPELMRRFIEH
jgi:hypothetical protein